MCIRDRINILTMGYKVDINQRTICTDALCIPTYTLYYHAICMEMKQSLSKCHVLFILLERALEISGQLSAV